MLRRFFFLAWVALLLCLARGDEVAVEGGNLKLDLPPGFTPLTPGEMLQHPNAIQEYGNPVRTAVIGYRVHGTPLKPEDVANLRASLADRIIRTVSGARWIKGGTTDINGTTWTLAEYIEPAARGTGAHNVAAFTSYHGLLLRVDFSAYENEWPQWHDQLEAALHSMRLTDAVTSPGTASADEEEALGQVALTAFNLNEADAHFQAALKQDPDFPDALVGEGQIALQRSEFEKAVPFFDQALSLNPHLARALELRAGAHFSLGEDVAAASDASKLEIVAPHAVLGTIMMAEFQARRGDFARAMALLHTALQRWPRYPYTYHALGWLYFNRGQTALALRVFEAAKLLAPGAAYPYYETGEVRFCCGEWNQALSDFTKATELAPNDNQVQDVRLLRWAATQFLRRPKDADTELEAYLKDEKAYKTPWVAHTGAFLERQESEQVYLGQMHDSNRYLDKVGQERACFFIAMRRLADGSWSQAKQALTQCAGSKVESDDTLSMARGLLRHVDSRETWLELTRNYGLAAAGLAALYLLGICILIARFARGPSGTKIPAGG